MQRWSTDSNSFCEFFQQQLVGYLLLILNPTVNHVRLKYYVQLVLYFLLFSTLQKHVIQIAVADDCYPKSDPETQYQVLFGGRRMREKRILTPHGKQSLLESNSTSKHDDDSDTINQPISRDIGLNEDSNFDLPDSKAFEKPVSHMKKKDNLENYSSQWELPEEKLVMKKFYDTHSENSKSRYNYNRMELKNSDSWNEIRPLGQQDPMELQKKYTTYKNLYGSSIISHELPSNSLLDIGVKRNFENTEKDNNNNSSESEHPFEIMDTNDIYSKKLLPEIKIVYNTSLVPVNVSTVLKQHEHDNIKSPYLPKDNEYKSNSYWSGNSIPENSNYTTFNKQYNSKKYKNNNYNNDLIRQQINNNLFDESQDPNEYANNINKTNALDNELLLDRYNKNDYPINVKHPNLNSDINKKHGSIIETYKSKQNFLSNLHQSRPYFNNSNKNNTNDNNNYKITKKENSNNDYRIYKNSDPTQINNSNTYHPNWDADQFFINSHHSKLPSSEQAIRSASWSDKHCSDQPQNKMYRNHTQIRLDQYSNKSININGYIPNEFLNNSFETELNSNEFNNVILNKTTDKKIYLNDFEKIDEFNLHPDRMYNKSAQNNGQKKTKYYSTTDQLNNSFVNNYSNIVNISNKFINSKPTNGQYYQIPGDLYKLEYDTKEKGNNISIYNESDDYMRPFKNHMINNYYVSYGKKNNNYNNNSNSIKTDKVINNTNIVNKSQDVELNNSRRHLTGAIVKKIIHNFVLNFTNQTVCNRSRFACELKNNLALVYKIMPILREIMIRSLTERQILDLNTSSTNLKKVQTSLNTIIDESTTNSYNQIMEIDKKTVNIIRENIRPSSNSNKNYDGIPEQILGDQTLLDKIYNNTNKNNENISLLIKSRNIINKKPRNNISQQIFLPVNFESINHDEKISQITKFLNNSTINSF